MHSIREELARGYDILQSLKSEDLSINVADLILLPSTKMINENINCIASEIEEYEKSPEETIDFVNSISYTPPKTPTT